MQITKELLFEHIKGSLGTPERVFRKAGIRANDARKFLKDNKLEEEFTEACAAELDKVIEVAEHKLLEKGIQSWDVPALKKFLEAKASHLGYGEKVSMDVNVPVQLQIVKKYGDSEQVIDVTPQVKKIE